MAEITFDLAELFERAFGYKSQAFKPQFSPVPAKKSLKPEAPLRREQGAHGSSYYAKDVLGTEYFMPVLLTYPDDTKLSKEDQELVGGDTVGLVKTWNLPYPIVSISSKKNIVETPLVERRGTVKELINTEDYEIVVKGFIIGSRDEFPENDVTTLRTIYEQNTPLSIQCPLTDIFLLRPDRSGSDQVVIRELKLLNLKGVKNVRPYELHLVSDEPFNLISIS